jgi:membrane protease YdiL (CAAX protease family)
VVIYTIGVMTLSAAGGIIVAGGAQAGSLVFLIGPLLMAVVLRALGGDGWADSGFHLGPLRWYAFAFLIFPVTFALILGAGALTGSIALTGSLGALLAATAVELAPRLVFAGFEELGWRGYLEPRLAALGVPDLRRHFLVGLIWAVWHIPYIMNTPAYTELSPVIFAPLLLGGVTVMAVVYGQLRRASNSVWPVVIAHGIGNAVAFPLVFGGSIEFQHPALLATRPENLLFIAIWVGIGWMMIRRKVAESATAEAPGQQL